MSLKTLNIHKERRWKSPSGLPSISGSFFPAKQIIKNLWIGSEGDSKDGSFFKKNDIRLIVNATANIPVRAPASIKSYRVPVDDDPSENDTLLNHLPMVVVVMDDTLKYGHGVLVHCRAGMQRSAAVVAAYLMWKKGLTADQALTFINSKKQETFWPRPTFEGALRAWEDYLKTNGRVRR